MEWLENYTLTKQNSTIAADGQEVFGQDTSSKEARNKYGSFNVAVVTVTKTTGCVIRIDGLTTKQYTLVQPGTFTIREDEGQFFDWIQIEDGDSTGITAGQVNVTVAIREKVKD